MPVGLIYCCLSDDNCLNPPNLIAFLQHDLDAVGVALAFGKNPFHMAACQCAGALIFFEHDIHQCADLNICPVLSAHRTFPDADAASRAKQSAV